MSKVAKKTLGQVNDEVFDALDDAKIDQYLTFFMAEEEFGINILSVQEIREWEPVTPIPNSPNQVLGFTNLRGTIAPVIDLRLCFGLQAGVYGDHSVVIIISVESEHGTKIMGVVVDAVSDVYSFTPKNIQPSPELSQTDQAQFVKGLGSLEDKMVILLELTDLLIANSDMRVEHSLATS